jgi:hypothetical protein
MTDCLNILAQTARTAAEQAQEAEQVVPVDIIWQQITSLGILEALTFIAFGTVCLFYGWRVFKVLVVISFALIGLFVGTMLTERLFGAESQLFGGLIGMTLFAFLSVPLMRWGVCILGAAAGGILTSGIWYACGLTEQYIWAGSLVGIVAGGMISFIIFRIAVMLFSCLGGSGLIITGTLALLYIYEPTKEQVQDLVYNHKWFLPVVLIIPTAIGVLLQHKFVKGSKEWDI